MKYVYLSGLFLALSISGATVWVKTAKTERSETNVVNVPNNTLSGNITNELKGSNDELVTNNKSIIKASPNAKRVVYLNDEVNYQTSSALVQSLKELEEKSTEPIYMLIDSPGGSVVDGAAVISQMEASKAPIYTVCTRLCASMAAMIHSYGHKRYALDRAILMYHPASAGAQGQVKNMISLLKTLDRYTNKMVANIVKRSKISRSEFDSLVSYELWIDSEDALNRGLLDGIVNLSVNSGTSTLGQEGDEARRKLHTVPNKASKFIFEMKSSVEFEK